MKIRIAKPKQPIVERWQMNTASSLQYILEDLFKPGSNNNIFNKKLIFYDLETNGFGDAAYVHQIAALEFELGPLFEKNLKGEPVSDDIKNLKATGGIIVKALFDEKDFKNKDEKTRDKRKSFYKKYFGSDKGRDPVPMRIGKKNMLSADGKIRFDYDPKNGEPQTIIGCSLCITEEIWQSNSEKVSDVLTSLESIRKVEIDPMTKALIEFCLEESSGGEGSQRRYQIKRPWIKPEGTNSDEVDLGPGLDSVDTPDEDELEVFFSKLYELFFTLSNAPYTFTKARGGESWKKKTAVLKKTWSSSKNGAFAFTYTENKNFTEYDKFPLERYRQGYGYNEDESRPSEKQGIVSFLEYLKGLGDDNYILIGHNIKAFDNAVILQRSKIHNISKILTRKFQNSKALDSLDLLNMYTKQMTWFSTNLDLLEKSTSNVTDQSREVAKESSRKVKEITKMHKRVKSKLDGMLKVFEETQDKKQTHTADDDCEDLARVLTLAVIDMFSMAKVYADIDQMMLKPATIGDVPTYKPLYRPPSGIAPKLKTKFKNDLIQLGIVDMAWATQKYGKETDKDTIDRVSERFTAWLTKKTKEENKNLSSEQVLHKLLNFKTRPDTNKAYKQWLAIVVTSDIEPEEPVTQQAIPVQTQFDFGLDENIRKKWKKIIK